MATLSINLMEVYRKLVDRELSHDQIRKFKRELEMRIGNWGRQFPGSSFHEKTVSTVNFGGFINLDFRSTRILSSKLVLRGIPSEAADNFFKDVFPELTANMTSLLPEKTGEEDA